MYCTRKAAPILKTVDRGRDFEDSLRAGCVVREGRRVGEAHHTPLTSPAHDPSESHVVACPAACCDGSRYRSASLCRDLAWLTHLVISLWSLVACNLPAPSFPTDTIPLLLFTGTVSDWEPSVPTTPAWSASPVPLLFLCPGRRYGLTAAQVLEVGELLHNATAARQAAAEQLRAESRVCSLPLPVMLEEGDLGEPGLLALSVDDLQ